MSRVSALFLGVAVILAAAPAIAAEDYTRNAWGIYAAPTIYGLAEGTRYNVASSATLVDLGVFYRRSLGPRWGARVEIVAAQRQLDVAVPFQPTGLPDGVYTIRVDESTLLIPVVLENDRRVPIGERELRVTLGAGVCGTFVLEQELLVPSGSPEPLTPGEYQKFGWLLDGGVTLGIDPRTGVFGRFRLYRDESTFGDSGVSLVEEFWAFSFAGGFEFGF